MSLIPTFVFPVNRPDYPDTVRASVVTLESVHVSEDLRLVGCVRVNAEKLQEARCGRLHVYLKKIPRHLILLRWCV